jgi:hypothetical protein
MEQPSGLSMFSVTIREAPVFVSHSEFVKLVARGPNQRQLLGDEIRDGDIPRLGMMMKHSEVQSMADLPTYDDGNVGGI